MRLREFWALMDAVFGEEYARTLAREMVVTDLDSRTVEQALHAGLAPRDVWHALCDTMDIPADRRDGGDRERMIPPAR